MTIHLHHCMCHEFSCGLCAYCELALHAELHAMENATYDANRSAFESQNPPGRDEA